MRVVFRPEAEADLLAIAIYVAEQSPGRAAVLVRRLRERCRILERLPFAGRERPELGLGVRGLLERPYLLLYRVGTDAIEVIAVIHSARDLPAAMAARAAKDEFEH
jgi:toxin ParE1/3/4